MSFENISLIQVYYEQKLGRKLVGRIALKNRQLLFEYSSEFIETGLEISPFKLPLKPGVQVNEDLIFDGLFGVFNDSLPDGWGRLLLDRKLRSLGVNPGNLSPLDRLRYVGSRGMGALTYVPEIEGTELPEKNDLDEIAAETYAFQENDADEFIDDLLAMNGSSAGARPKIMLQINEEDWLIKFRSSVDPKDIGPIEYAYHLMAEAAGLVVPEAKLFPSKTGPGYFGVKRFDHVNSDRIHMHTICGLIHSDHRLPSLDYETIMKVTTLLTKNVKQSEAQFRVAVFNVLSHNRDDHSKNFSYLMDSKGNWSLSPSYDLTFSSGPSGEHCSMIMGEGKNPNIGHLLELATISGIGKKKSLEIIDEVRAAVSEWRQFAKAAGVSKSSDDLIQTTIERFTNNFK